MKTASGRRPVRRALLVFRPEQLQADSRSAQVPMHLHPVRQRPQQTRRRRRAPEEELLELPVINALGQRPAQTLSCGAFQVTLHGGPRQPDRDPDLVGLSPSPRLSRRTSRILRIAERGRGIGVSP
jgi:hypothetical protein